MAMTKEQQRSLSLARARLRLKKKEPEMSALSQTSAAAGQFAEGVLGVGDEAGAIGRAIGGSVYDVFNTDKDLSKILSDNFDWGRNIEATRKQMDQLDEANPALSNVAYGAGMVSGLALPIGVAGKGASMARSATVGAGTGAAYGALAGRDEGRLTGAAVGAGLGGAMGAGAQKLAKVMQNKEATVVDEVQTAFDGTNFTNVGDRMGNWEDLATGVSDGVRRRISPEAAGLIERADQSAMRQRTLDVAEYVENTDMQRVINFTEEDKTFKGMVLDFARGAGDQASLFRYVEENLDTDAAKAMAKYFRWAESNNAKYNTKLGQNQSAVKYMHTQKAKGLPQSSMLAKKGKEDVVDVVDDVNLPEDIALKELSRGLAMKGEVNVDDYANPFLTNANRISNNQRLLQLQEKFGIDDISGGANGLMEQIEKKLKSGGISEEGARDARNAVATLVKGQNQSANAWVKSFQNSGYSVLAGPKTVLLNFHDIPVAVWNNGLSSAKGLLNRNVYNSADVKRLGIDGQNVGEFTQDMRKMSAKRTAGETAEKLTKTVTDKAMKWGGFATADRVAKNRVLRTVAQDTVDRAKSGKLQERWGTYFKQDELNRIAAAVNATKGDVSKMKPKDAKLYDELITLGLGQQQLISASGRPPAWLRNPNARPLWMMRGFAIKHNALLSEKIIKKMKNGDKAGAAKEASMYLALPGSSYAAMNVGRNELFKEDYDANGEEFMYSLLDSVLGPVTLNSVGLGSSYERAKLDRSPADSIASALLPPLGLYGDIVDSSYKAAADGDVEELAKLVTDHPLAKQWLAFFEGN